MSDFVVTVNSTKRKIGIRDDNSITIDNKPVDIRLSKVNDYLYLVKMGNKVFEITTNKVNNEKSGFLIDGHYFEAIARTNLKEKAVEFLKNKKRLSHHDEVTAPMPGLIIKLKKREGDKVELGESIITLEAMKMENDIRSPATGNIKEVRVKEGDSVEKGGVILIIE